MYEEYRRQQALVILALVELLGYVHVLGDGEIAKGNLVRTDANDGTVSEEKGMDSFTLLEAKRV